MSLYLGKIHYWLYNKILWFEGLEVKIIELAVSEELNVNELSSMINAKYGSKLEDKPLEEIIDTSNIHGWLQGKIHSAEGRMAAWTTAIINNNKNSLDKINNIYISQGSKAANEVKTKININNAKDIYNSVNDYILDGMPCDRVNELIKSEDEVVEWKRRVCVHKDIWEKEDCDVNIFYNLRSSWIKAFVNEVNSKYEYTESEDSTISIKLK